MKIVFIGLGKMGFNMVQRLLNDNHELVVWNIDPTRVYELEKIILPHIRAWKMTI